jgi:hypothetical protein
VSIVRRLAFVGVLLLVLAPVAGAVSDVAIPVHHGELHVKRARGRFDRTSGLGTITVRGWVLKLGSGSDGIVPDEEPLVVAIGDDSFRLPARALRRKGKRTYRYRARGRVTRGVQKLRMRQQTDDTWIVDFTVRAVPLYRLTTEAPVCLATAIIVGDDDGFAGVQFDNPGFPVKPTKRLVVDPVDCTADGWPWV